MGKEDIRLDQIGICLVCGAHDFEVSLERDHAFPRSMARKPNLGKIQNPFHDVIFSRYNVFRLCHEHHRGIDNKKNPAFSSDGFVTLNPVRLLTFLLNEYPITKNRKYRDIQIENLLKTNERFVEVAINLNGELPKDLVDKYQDAIDVAKQFKEKLESLKTKHG